MKQEITDLNKMDENLAKMIKKQKAELIPDGKDIVRTPDEIAKENKSRMKPRYFRRKEKQREYRLMKKSVKFFERAQAKKQLSNQARIKLKKQGFNVELNSY